MKRLAILLPLALLGCPASGGGTTAGPTASAQPSARAPAAAPKPAAPSTLSRKKTPKDLRLEDEKACDGGDIKACRHVADRYRGYGHVAGCGVDRDGTPPRRMATAADAESDRRLFDKWIRKVCDLGDDEACLEGAWNVQGIRLNTRVVDACAGGAGDECPLYLWATGMRPDAKAAIDKDRTRFLTSGTHGKLFVELYRREKSAGGDTLPSEVSELAKRICKTTKECDDVFMMLDKNGWTPAAIAPLKKAVADDYAAMCLEGDCTCGLAARYLDASDPRALDLARIGCGDGDADACFVLGDLFERGAAGLEKDPGVAFSYYEVACPRVIADDGREEVISKPACARLADRYAEGGLVEPDRLHEFHYATLACAHPGFERDHTPCVRRALLHYVHDFVDRDRNTWTTQQIGREFLNGPDGAPIDGKECARPSVAEACKKAKTEIH